jgi:hypothetical protein
MISKLEEWAAERVARIRKRAIISDLNCSDALADSIVVQELDSGQWDDVVREELERLKR